MEGRDDDVEIVLLRRALTRAQAELRACEERYRTVTRATNDAVWEWDIARNALTWNEGVRTLFGYHPGQIEQTIGWWENNIHPDDRPRVMAGLTRTIESGRDVWSDEYRYRRADGSYAHVLGRGIVLRNRQGKATRMIGAVTDTTELKQAQARLALAARLASVGTLAAGVAHEINNPLAFIVANLDVAIRRLSKANRPAALEAGPARAEERGGGGGGGLVTAEHPSAEQALLSMLEDAREGAERVRLIVRDLTTFARAEDERRGPVDVARVLNSCVQMAMNEIRHRAQVVRDFTEVPPVEAQEARLGQVFLNLIVNAAQAIPEGAADRNTISLSTRLDLGGRVVVEIRDTGRGIAPEVLGRIFDPFYTSKQVGEGLGLGLSICHSIVTGLGGEIAVESEPGKGSTFRVSLPASPSTARAIATAVGTQGAHAEPRGRILIVDDEPLLTRAIAGTLASEHDTVSTRGAREALARIQGGERFDVILCDLMMPELTGMEFHDALGRIAPDQQRRIVFLTGGAFTERARMFLEAPGRRLLLKPFDATTLLSIVAEVISAEASASA